MTIQACARCDAGPKHLYIRKPGESKPSRRGDQDADAFCARCDQAVDTVDRDRHTDGGGLTPNGLAAQLAATDPDSVGAEGGERA